jgi:hypothetical protein
MLTFLSSAGSNFHPPEPAFTVCVVGAALLDDEALDVGEEVGLGEVCDPVLDDPDETDVAVGDDSDDILSGCEMRRDEKRVKKVV